MAPDIELEVDHIRAVKRGGTNEDSNLVTACVGCNRGKWTHDLPEPPPITREAPKCLAEKIEHEWHDLDKVLAEATAPGYRRFGA